jgi:protein ImuB
VYLKSLPVAALRLELSTLQTLRELDVSTIGQLLALPRASLPAHLGRQVVLRIDQALGEVAEQIVPVQLAREVEVSQAFPHPLCRREELAVVLRQLLEQLVEQLQPRREGVQGLLVRFDGADRDHRQFSLGLVGPSNSATYIAQMAVARMELQPLPQEVVGVQIRATSTAFLTVQQTGLFEDSAELQEQKQFQQLIDCLSVRLGEQAVLAASLFPDAQPEFAFRWHPRVQGLLPISLEQVSPEQVSPGVDDFFFARPLWLKQTPLPITVLAALADGPPLRFHWKARDHFVVRSWGPERVETGWWRMSPIQRDYYRVETSQGQRFWLFRQISAGVAARSWFLHGVF